MTNVLLKHLNFDTGRDRTCVYIIFSKKKKVTTLLRGKMTLLEKDCHQFSDTKRVFCGTFDKEKW